VPLFLCAQNIAEKTSVDTCLVLARKTKYGIWNYHIMRHVNVTRLATSCMCWQACLSNDVARCCQLNVLSHTWSIASLLNIRQFTIQLDPQSSRYVSHTGCYLYPQRALSATATSSFLTRSIASSA
jgi:hypothetical protein